MRLETRQTSILFALPKACLQPDHRHWSPNTGVCSATIGLLSKSHGIEPHHLHVRQKHEILPRSRYSKVISCDNNNISARPAQHPPALSASDYAFPYRAFCPRLFHQQPHPSKRPISFSRPFKASISPFAATSVDLTRQ